MPPARCAVTMVGFTSRVTVHMPSRPWKITRPTSGKGRVGTPAAPSPGQPREGQDHQPQPAGEIAVHHLLPGLGGVHRALRVGGVGLGHRLRVAGDHQPTIATGPVRATQTGIAQPHIGPQHDHGQGQQGGNSGKRGKGASLHGGRVPRMAAPRHERGRPKCGKPCSDARAWERRYRRRIWAGAAGQRLAGARGHGPGPGGDLRHPPGPGPDPGDRSLFPTQDFFRTALVVHVDQSVLIWFLAFAGVLWALAAGRSPGSPGRPRGGHGGLPVGGGLTLPGRGGAAPEQLCPGARTSPVRHLPGGLRLGRAAPARGLSLRMGGGASLERPRGGGHPHRRPRHPDRRGLPVWSWAGTAPGVGGQGLLRVPVLGPRPCPAVRLHPDHAGGLDLAGAGPGTATAPRRPHPVRAADARRPARAVGAPDPCPLRPRTRRRPAWPSPG